PTGNSRGLIIQSPRRQVDNQFVFGRQLDWKISRLHPFEYLVHIPSCAAVRIRDIRTVADQSAILSIFAIAVHSWNPHFAHAVHDQLSGSEQEGVIKVHEYVGGRLLDTRQAIGQLGNITSIVKDDGETV